MYILVVCLISFFVGFFLTPVLYNSGIPMWAAILILATIGWFVPDVVNFFFPALKGM